MLERLIRASRPAISGGELPVVAVLDAKRCQEHTSIRGRHPCRVSPRWISTRHAVPTKLGVDVAVLADLPLPARRGGAPDGVGYTDFFTHPSID